MNTTAQAHTYRVEVTREDKYWIIRVPELLDNFDNEPVLTQARRYDEIESQARDLICVTADVAPSTIDLDVHVTVDDLDLVGVGRRLRNEREQVAELEQRVITESRDTARKLREAGLDLRDIGEVVGVSFQRVSQLLSK
ncbi:HicB-like antitoxin [Gordonia phage DelRio]|uniref:HicB-like antitoxin n=7 Tax=Betterkatzvirus betterkatz TaxID=2560485 RepID=A0A2Z5HF48_9CAUD|nr:HicB-like antitoxin [Gordonia phage BetterKatz]AXC38112.1 hypothetical protein SEA_NADEEM_34 [Gordonia phage Nadeem]AXH47255.1 HicB-like antitoxin [Gordonia phage DelRio]AZS11202.1 hypothetical protein PBI_WHEATTHIN_34 [Gordonia phage WheatThin]QAU06832.1 HicB-like antitoxin [Gordonia phage Brylie]QAX92530.1 HicB-like antitoxin [Gordonia phage Mulch]QAY06491.1 HicB-like antitoxin [Gordonia phage Parada]QPL13909.1 HicB-like antitoxin [Gordonia phage NancyRae]QSL99897.1 HicB-like antitoxin